MNVDAKQWVQPLFMVYDVGTDEQVPLTQERLDQLTKTERQYGMLIMEIKRSHEAHLISMNITPKVWPALVTAAQGKLG